LERKYAQQITERFDSEIGFYSVALSFSLFLYIGGSPMGNVPK
jgi:hypothetical protein